MNTRKIQHRCSSPACFAVVPSVRPRAGGLAGQGSVREDSRASLARQLAEKSDEAKQNWEALIEVRGEMTHIRGELDVALAGQAHLRHRIRRWRSKYRDQRRVIEGLVPHAERIAQAEQRTIEALMKGSGGALGNVSEALPGRQIRSVSQALSQARRHFATLSIPDEVAKDAKTALDRSGSRKSRGRAVWASLAALDAYVLDDAFSGDFEQWCRSGRGEEASYSANRVASGESKSVRRRERMMRARALPVDPALHASGRRQMTAHIKLDQGEAAPRLHFFDDKRGSTGKVHIGYIGPHLPTAHDPT